MRVHKAECGQEPEARVLSQRFSPQSSLGTRPIPGSPSTYHPHTENPGKCVK